MVKNYFPVILLLLGLSVQAQDTAFETLVGTKQSLYKLFVPENGKTSFILKSNVGTLSDPDEQLRGYYFDRNYQVHGSAVLMEEHYNSGDKNTAFAIQSQNGTILTTEQEANEVKVRLSLDSNLLAEVDLQQTQLRSADAYLSGSEVYFLASHYQSGIYTDTLFSVLRVNLTTQQTDTVVADLHTALVTGASSYTNYALPVHLDIQFNAVQNWLKVLDAGKIVTYDLTTQLPVDTTVIPLGYSTFESLTNSQSAVAVVGDSIRFTLIADEVDSARSLMVAANYKLVPDAVGKVVLNADSSMVTALPVYFNVADTSKTQVLIIKIAKDGSEVWHNLLADDEISTIPSHLVKTTDGGYLIGGTTTVAADIIPPGVTTFNYKAYFGKVNEDGSDVSIAEEVTKNRLSLYPNPATDVVFIEGIKQEETYTYNLYNVAGLKVKNGLLNNEATIQLEGLTKGTYILHIISAKGEVSTQKFVKK